MVGPTLPAIFIDGRRIAADAEPYIIAELSANHGGDLERAKRIIRMAAERGAHAIKFQAYTADEMTLDSDRPDFVVQADNPWKGERLHALYTRAATPYEWFPELFATARAHGITPFASPFGLAGVEILKALDAPAYKIASFEAVDLDLIAACARTGRPMILSVGMCTIAEIEEAVAAFRAAGGRELALLRCNSAYPADPREANLATIPDMAARFGIPIGYSDHTLDAIQAAVAVSLGACIVEKHVIDAREPPTADSMFSSLPEQLEELVTVCRAAWQARGSVSYGAHARESQSLVFRRSLYACRRIEAGEPLTDDNVRCVRPAHGLKPKHKAEVMGRKAGRAIEAGEPITWDALA
ncbi:MAG: pseudaminic acid synthase [Solirubrobacterales bacterium]